MCGSMFIFLGGLLSASLVLILSLLTCKSPLVLIPSLASEAALLYFTSTLSKPQLFALIDTLNDPFQYAALILPFLGAGTLVSALAYTDKWHQACDVAFYAQFLVATALRMLIVFSAPRYEGSTSSPEGVPVWMVGECVILLLLINYDGIGARAVSFCVVSYEPGCMTEKETRHVIQFCHHSRVISPHGRQISSSNTRRPLLRTRKSWKRTWKT
ncbi:hypothetical protein BDW02DRAFT_565782 [Decorospora gaudefroyi]|uniref:Uncharacterized protein n=1 Tax=Decorospora gaudefroyi TaxID=184978 RepID=A0A6A5KT73_9PLEO|nr:hypothetical protein BDW02DRAFT_565782 [Decorospora gaudefroyi]